MRCCISNCLSSSRLNTTRRLRFSRSSAVAMNRFPNESVPPVTSTDFPCSAYIADARCPLVTRRVKPRGGGQAGSRGQHLVLAHPVEMTALARGELVEAPLLDDLAVAEHVDAVAAADRRE